MMQRVVVVQSILHFVPQSRLLQGRVDDSIGVLASAYQPLDACAEGNVLVNGLGKRIGLLRDPSEALSDVAHVIPPVIDVQAVEGNAAGQLGPGDKVVRAIEASQEGRLATPRRSYEGCHLTVIYLKTHVIALASLRTRS